MRLVFIFLLALALRGGLAAFRYTDDFRNFENGDYLLYDIGAAHFRAAQNFDNSLFLVRPPAYPLLIYTLNNDKLLVLIAGVLAGALVAPVTYFLALQFGLSRRFSLIAALIVAVDPASVAYSAFLGPEPIANLLIVVAVTALLYALKAATPSRALLWGSAAGIALALSSLSRPASFLLWVPFALILLITQRKHLRPGRVGIGAFTLINLLAVVGWTYHNGVVFGNPTFSTITPYTMLYYHAAAVERFATGQTPEETFVNINRRIETRLGHDAANVDEGTRHGYLAATVEVQNALYAESLDIFRAHPLETLATLPLGFARMFSTTQTIPEWFRIIELPFNLLVLAGTFFGLWLAFRQKRWLLFWCVFLICVYFTVGNLIVKTSGLDTRERSMLTPFMATVCAYALAWLDAKRLKSPL